MNPVSARSDVVAVRRSERGAELIEMAFTLPLLLLVVVGIIDFGFLFQRYQAVTNAAREGARVGVLPGYEDGDIEARVAAYLTTSGLTSVTPTIARASIAPVGGGTPFTVVTVTVSYPHQFMFLSPIAALFGGGFGTMTLTARSVMRAELAAGGGT